MASAQVSVQASPRDRASWLALSKEVDELDLEAFLHDRDLPLLVQLALAHYQFEVIHPFLDGNGRIGRLLIPTMLVLRGALPQLETTGKERGRIYEAPLIFEAVYGSIDVPEPEFERQMSLTSLTGRARMWPPTTSDDGGASCAIAHRLPTAGRTTPGQLRDRG